MVQRILFRLDADHRIGMGHLKRCLSLAEEVRRSGGAVQFLLKHWDQAAIEVLQSRGFDAPLLLPEFDYLEELEWFKKENTHAEILFLDVTHAETLARIFEFSKYIEGLKSLGWLVVLMDGLSPQAAADKLVVMPSIVITPYFGAKKIAGIHHLFGPDYFVCGPGYQDLSKREVRKKANRVLLTFGGSDLCGITAKVLDVVEHIESLDVRVIIGPSYSLALRHKVSERVSRRIQMVDSPLDLLPHFLWCDIAVSSSGLTKYELALTGTPSLLISTDVVHAQINQEFIQAGLAIDLGVHSDVTSSHLLHQIMELLEDYRHRERLSRSGQEHLNSGGVGRILHEVRSLKG